MEQLVIDTGTCDYCGEKRFVAEIVVPVGWENGAALICEDCLLGIAHQIVEFRKNWPPLKSMPAGDLAKIPIVTDEEVDEALAKGAEEARKVRESQGSVRIPNIPIVR
jgi:hypothetical protein